MRVLIKNNAAMTQRWQGAFHRNGVHMSKFMNQFCSDLDARLVNGNLLPARSSINTALIGSPRGDYSAECQDATDHGFIAQVSSFEFAGKQGWALTPFCEVLERVQMELRALLGLDFDRVSHDGGLCCRLSRRSPNVISNHSWGIAIDLSLKGFEPKHEAVPLLLLQIARVFIKHRVFWGVAFPHPEVMHFEASQQLVHQWARDGRIRGGRSLKRKSLQFGDRSLAVRRLQCSLNRLLEPSLIAEDGIFGVDTRNAVIEAHVRLGLDPASQASRQFIQKLSA